MRGCDLSMCDRTLNGIFQGKRARNVSVYSLPARSTTRNSIEYEVLLCSESVVNLIVVGSGHKALKSHSRRMTNVHHVIDHVRYFPTK